MTVTRRDFVRIATAGAAATTCGFALEKPIPKPIPIVDTHVHLWDIKRFNLPWLKGADRSIQKNFLVPDYRAATKGMNVTKTIYMEVNVHPSQQTKEAEYVIDLCKRKDNNMVAAVIGGYPYEKDFAARARKFARSKFIKGFRTVLHDPDRKKGLCLQPTFVENAKLLGKLGLSFDFCMRPAEVMDAAKLAERCPKTRFILDHCGNMPVMSRDKKLRATWERGIKAMANLKNTICKISGIIVTADKQGWKPSDLESVVSFCLDAFGEDRCIFAADWPVCTLRASFAEWVNAVRWIVRKRPVAFQRKLFHDNAVKFYGLS